MYESMIKCRGKAILPPVMTQERRSEARHYRNEAVRRQQLRVRRETGETNISQIEGSPEKKLVRWRSEEQSTEVVQTLGKENGTSPSRIPRSSSAQANLHLSRPSTQIRSRFLVDKDLPSARILRHEGPPIATRQPRSQQEPSREPCFVREQELCESPTRIERGGTFIVSSEGTDEEKPQQADLREMTERMRMELCLDNEQSVAVVLDSDSPSYESATDEDFSLTLSAAKSTTREDHTAVSTLDDVSVLMLELDNSESQIVRRPSSLSMQAEQPRQGSEADVEPEEEQGHNGCESRKCLGRRHTYLILQATHKAPALSVAPTPEEKQLLNLAERLQSCANLVSSLSPTSSPMTNRCLESLHETFRRATSSSPSLTAYQEQCRDVNANRPDQATCRRVDDAVWSDRNGNRPLQNVVKQELDSKTALGFVKFTALCKGHLCRKLLRCSRVRGVISSIADMVQMACALHSSGETEPDDQDLALHEKVLVTLDASCQELYRIFFEASSAEKIQLIRESSANQTTFGQQNVPVKRLSSATLKRRIRLQQDAEQKSRQPCSPFRRTCCASTRAHLH